jgi:hypothetical protein
MDNSNVTPLHPKEKTQKEEASLVSALSPSKKLRNMGSDLGHGLKDFKKAIKDDEKPTDKSE